MNDVPTSDRLIVNCLPLTADERRRFVEAAAGVRQEFVGDDSLRGQMAWPAGVPEGMRPHATAVIGNVPADSMGDYPRLEWLQTWSAGVDRYLVPGVLGDTVRVTNATGAYGQSVAEHLFAMMWSLMKNLPQYRDNQRMHEWRDAGPAMSPKGMTVVVVGTGDIGSTFATMVKGVGARTLGVRRDPNKPAAGIDSMFGFDALDVLLTKADVVAITVPSSPRTHHLFDAHRFALLKPDAIVLNAGRGDVIDTTALHDAMGGLRGVGLDVTEPEPLPADDPLWDEPRCLITPHVAGGNHLDVTVRRIIEIALDNVANYAQGRPLHNLVRR
ncbi:D-2-hydroxyacid dehydrogenase [Bifidobacterium sp. 82T24]|uniref:D-2-hydroxyacid dehydrogenase n=1 Tax=Bifidobacterium pluvialisilvae TaxID=2834436 RepID=UPI001C566504|nr:D-2-hydroxyacid dehydrogenase [Bifidobacterium pluvialisilvae]MBW3087408.1 D-2-hydroxyacid dehydrogenase [Bifidobacterium pluvialisilvae]